MSANKYVFLFVSVLTVLFSSGLRPGHAESVEAITKPSADILLSFVNGGRILKVLVKEGDVVKKGQLLSRQEDEVELIQLQQLEAKAKDTTQIALVEAELAQKREDLKKLQWAKKEGAATDWEIEHSALNVQTSELSLGLTKFEHEQDLLRRDELKARLDRLRLFSPITGRVEEVAIEPGETAEGLAPLIRVVKVDPLWIDVPVPLAKARELKRQQAVYVTFPDSLGQDGKEPVEGRIKNIAVVADAASDTLRIRVEVPNPSLRPAGERVSVSFEDADMVANTGKK